jgi:DNA-binding MarR family transcriptional regulator
VRDTRLSDDEYRALAAVRYRIRTLLTFSEEQARAVGIEPQQHQLLLAIRGLPPDTAATVGVVAERLQVRHHSAVQLADRAEQAGLVSRASDPADRRRALLELTDAGAQVLETLSQLHLAEMSRLASELSRALRLVARSPRVAAGG